MRPVGDLSWVGIASLLWLLSAGGSSLGTSSFVVWFLSIAFCSICVMLLTAGMLEGGEEEDGAALFGLLTASCCC